jgi:GNAT superfamily N-acetyltransferase
VSVIDPTVVRGLRADGRLLLVRPAQARDGAGLVALTDAVCEHSIYLRFFSANRESARRYYATLVDVPDAGRFALVACDRDEIVAVACAEPLTPITAEVALLVDDRYQGHGVGTHLLDQLMSRARLAGIKSFMANVLAENHTMLSVLRDLGYTAHRSIADAAICLTWCMEPEAEPGPSAQSAVDKRGAEVGPFGGRRQVFGPGPASLPTSRIQLGPITGLTVG